MHTYIVEGFMILGFKVSSTWKTIAGNILLEGINENKINWKVYPNSPINSPGSHTIFKKIRDNTSVNSWKKQKLQIHQFNSNSFWKYKNILWIFWLCIFCDPFFLLILNVIRPLFDRATRNLFFCLELTFRIESVGCRMEILMLFTQKLWAISLSKHHSMIIRTGRLLPCSKL